MRNPIATPYPAKAQVRGGLLLACALLALAGPGRLSAGLFWHKPTVVPEWSRFQQAFQSSVSYSNPVQEATLKVRFVSPQGETTEVYGFWDGGKVWRVRFAPDQPGHWSYRTSCSDPANRGLNDRSGRFLCSAPVGLSRFHQHGPIRVALDHRHLEQADGTPFFWLADTTWNGARRASAKDWDLYAQIRSSQGYSVVQWAVAPGKDERGQTAYSGFPERIAINPEFFQRLDARIERLSESGLLSAIAPLAELADVGQEPLPEDQAVLLVRYAVARWGGDPVAWVLAFQPNAQGQEVERWKKIGQEVFAGMRHAPVVLYPGQAAGVLGQFRDQAWVDVFASQPVAAPSENALKAAFAGPFSQEWTRQPARPLLAVSPCENGFIGQTGKRFSPTEVRQAIYWSLLLAPPAGLSYSAQGVVNWDQTTSPKTAGDLGADMPLWQKALFLPAGKQMFHLAGLMNSVPFWRLRPEPKLVAVQAGDTDPRHYLAAAATEANRLVTVYVPEQGTVQLSTERLPPAPTLTWFNPRTGETAPAVAVMGDTCQVPAPAPGDWLLELTAKTGPQ